MKRTAATLIAAAAVFLAATDSPARPGPREPKAGQPIQLLYQELDHWHGGYEVDLHVDFDGSFQLWAVTEGSSVKLMDHQHSGDIQAVWATWYATLVQTDFYVVLFDEAGNVRDALQLPVLLDNNPF